MSIAASVSVSVPIWFGLMRMALAIFLRDAFGEDLGVGDEDIVADELHLAPSLRVSTAQPSQSFSLMPSSMRDDGILRDQTGQIIGELARS